MHIQKQFIWDGKIATLLKNLNEADIAFSFNIKYKGQKQGKEMPINGKATELDIYNDSGTHVVPVGSVLYRDDRATWHISESHKIIHINDGTSHLHYLGEIIHLSWQACQAVPYKIIGIKDIGGSDEIIAKQID